MTDHENSSPANRRVPWNKGKLIGARPLPAAKACLGDQNSTAVEGTNTRPRYV